MKNKLTNKEFIERSITTHGNKYDYSLVNYINNYTNVKIICYTHGIFEQNPRSHTSGSGCPKCGGCGIPTTMEFIDRSNKVHNNMYDYHLTEYLGSRRKVVIICPTHGIFEQTPHGHLNGRGCPECGGSKKKSFKYFTENLTIEEDPKEIDGDIYCKCAYCKIYFKPSRSQLISRIKSLTGKGHGEHRLYCSDKCKDLCPIFGQALYPKGDKPYNSRPDQPELRRLVLERDGNQCQRCGSTTSLHCHHITGAEINPVESADIDNCITLCDRCHSKAHSDNGCHYNDMRKHPCII